MSIISKETIVSHYESEEEFPIALSEVWGWLGYSKKENALQSFRNLEMAESLDFIQLLIDKPRSIKPLTEIKMTIDCFKLWAMSAQTAKGKEVRLRYLEIEKEWKAQKSAIPQISAEQVEAFMFQKDIFSPWSIDHTTAAKVFLGWQGIAAPVQPIAPVVLSPSIESQKALDGAFLNLNRSGLMMNKLFHFLDRVPTMKVLDEDFVNEMVAALSESEKVRAKLTVDLKTGSKQLEELEKENKRLKIKVREFQIEFEREQRYKREQCAKETAALTTVWEGKIPLSLKSAT